MKKYFPSILFVFFLFPHKKIGAQTASLTISYITSEKSKDSHSTAESFSLNGSTLAYTVKYSGRRGPNQVNSEETCTLTDTQVDMVMQKINEKRLNVTDSLIINSAVDESPASSVAIALSLTKGNKSSKIKVKGNPEALRDKTLYKNSLSLIYYLKSIKDACR